MKMTEEQAIGQIIEALETLGWGCAIPNQKDGQPLKDDDVVTGMIIGTPEYIDSILSGEHIETDA